MVINAISNVKNTKLKQTLKIYLLFYNHTTPLRSDYLPVDEFSNCRIAELAH